MLVQYFREIGKSWKTDGSIENEKIINQSAYGVFQKEKNRVQILSRKNDNERTAA